MALPRQTKTFFFRTISIVLAVVPLVWIFLRLDFNVLFQYIPMVAWWTIPVLCFLIFLSTFLQGFRWWILLRAMTPDVPFLRVLSYHFIGVFYSVVLPTSASADIVRTVLLAKKIDYSVAWGATFLCRIIGFFVLVVLLFDRSLRLNDLPTMNQRSSDDSPGRFKTALS